MGLGNLITLKPITSTISTTANNNNNKNKNKIKKTKIIRISDEMYQRFVHHSHRFYNVESYETILSDLLDCYSKQNTPDYSSHIHSNK